MKHLAAILLLFLIASGCQTSDPRIELSRHFELWKVLGSSAEGQPIYYNECGTGDSVVLVFGCFHGDEQEGGQLVIRLAELVNLQRADSLKNRIVFVPIVNPDGVAQRTRTNANGVDINRNFPTKNWSAEATEKRYTPGPSPASEPETRLVMDLLERYKPALIITVHTALHVINYDGPAKEIAERMAKHNGYRVSASIGYPTPGSFGTYAGVERNIPTITLELPPVAIDESWEQNREAMWTVIGRR
ncbi:MAG: murein peptide amidase A [Ignavibacteriae bacterium]|nr:murein peptide amidase A [Ignavibacteriota bacterium]